jgi:toxin ParE1/3/4
MAARYVLSPRAKSDLEEIWGYTEIHWGLDQAQRYIRELQRHVEIMATHPKSGRSCPEVSAGYYKYRAGSHFLFCRVTNGGVEVVRMSECTAITTSTEWAAAPRCHQRATTISPLSRMSDFFAG